MSLATVDGRRSARLLATAMLGAMTTLVAGVTGAFSPLVTVATAGSCAALPSAAAMFGRGLRLHAAARANPRLRGSCRCAGTLGLGTLATGLTAAVLPLLPPERRPAAAVAGMLIASVPLMIGLLHLPGVASPAGRLRHGLDGAITGISVALIGWLLAPGFGVERPAVYLAAAVAASCAAITATAMLRTSQRWPAAASCAGGAVLTVVGLALLVVALGRTVPQWGVLVAAALVVAAPALTWLGARRVETGPAGPVADPAAPGGMPAERAEASGGYPMLALPIGGAVLAMCYHLLVAGRPDRPALWLGMAIGALLALREIPAAADLRRLARRLTVQQARLRALVAAAYDAVLLLDDEMVVRWQAGGKPGFAGPALVGRRLTELLHPDDIPEAVDRLRAVLDGPPVDPAGEVVLAVRVRDPARGWRPARCTVMDLRADPQLAALVVWVRPVGPDPGEAVRRLTGRDRLTGLPDRGELLRAVHARGSSGRHPGALLMVELAGFCPVNDRHGRAAGDAVLRMAADRLRTAAGFDDFVARLGERQFGLVTPADPVSAHAIGHRVLAALEVPYPIPGGARPVAVSVGISQLAAGDPQEVLRRAELAAHRAGERDRARIDWYDESVEEHLVRRQDLERHLPGAAGRGELELAYQPIVALDDDRPVAVEALLRWRHPVLGTVLPAELLPVADRLGVAVEIGVWVLHTACRQVARWRRDGHDLWLSINVSADVLADPEFVPEVAAALSVHQSPPERLTVEISEGQVAAAPLAVVAGALSRLRAIGVRTALDDFGGAATDPARLRRLPLDLVKLSRSMVATADGPAGGPADGLVDAMSELAARFGLTVVAVGIERDSQRRRLLAVDCQLGQGFLIAAPVAAPHLRWQLERHRPQAVDPRAPAVD